MIYLQAKYSVPENKKGDPFARVALGKTAMV